MKLNLGLILLGLLFFFNPNFNLFDIMPDFIGALLIMAGLSKMYMYDGNFEDAKRSAKFLLWISLLRFALSIWISSANRDYLLPFTFIVCVLEAIYMISMFKGLYLGAEYTLMRADCEKYVNVVHEAFTMSFIFTIASKLLEFAPNICDLVKQDAELDLSSGASFKMSMAQMRVYVLGVCLIFGLLLGIIYLFVTMKAWIRMIADKRYSIFLAEKYNDYAENERDALVADKIEKFYALITFGFAFLFDFHLDGINVIPSVIGIFLLFAASMYLCTVSGAKRLPSFSLTIAAAASSVIGYLYMTKVHFGINYTFSLEAFYKKEFPLLESNISVNFAALFAFLECVLTYSLILLVLSQARKVFSIEKRTVAIPMLKFLRIPTLLACVSTALSKIFTTIEGHLATNPDVLGYVQNKAYITNELHYKSFMENPLIVQYENISAVSYYTAFISVALVIICVLYTFRIRRFTDK